MTWWIAAGLLALAVGLAGALETVGRIQQESEERL